MAIVGSTGAGKSQLLYDIEKLAQGDSKSKRIILVNDKKPNKGLRFGWGRIKQIKRGVNFP